MTKKLLFFSLFCLMILLAGCTSQPTPVAPATNGTPIEPPDPFPINQQQRCGPSVMGHNYSPENCDTSCEQDSDCISTCGCGTINKNEICHDEDIIWDCVASEVECANGTCGNIVMIPNCADGITFYSYYPNPDGDITFKEDMAPSQELLDIRVAYSNSFACVESAKEGYYIKQGDVFIKVSQEEFEKFIEDYNAECNDCLTKHMDGCC